MEPVTLRDGKVVDKITIGTGTTVLVSIRTLNRSKLIWGADALEFRPERWLDNESGLPRMAKELQGFHHLFTFIDGPRTCLGKTFAVTEIKVGFQSDNSQAWINKLRPYLRHLFEIILSARGMGFTLNMKNMALFCRDRKLLTKRQELYL